MMTLTWFWHQRFLCNMLRKQAIDFGDKRCVAKGVIIGGRWWQRIRGKVVGREQNTIGKKQNMTIGEGI